VIALETYASADARRKGTAAQDKGNRTGGLQCQAHANAAKVRAETDANANAAHLQTVSSASHPRTTQTNLPK